MLSESKSQSSSLLFATRNLMKLPDRISALPEPIIHEILSLLPTKSVKLATCLSKTWYDFCSSFPYLDFDDSLFDANHDIVAHPRKHINFNFDDSIFDTDDEEGEEEEEEEEEVEEELEEVKEVEDTDPNLETAREKYVNYVSETLRRFHERNPKIQIKRLRIPITIINSRISSILNGWIQLALDHGVEEFDLETRGNWYELPKAVFESSSIRVLKLEGCTLHLSKPFDHRGVSKTNTKLQELYLKRVHMDEVALISLFLYCPLIETLYIEDILCIANLRISHLDKLKTLVINTTGTVDEMLENIEVDAPALETLHALNSTDHQCYPNSIGMLICPILSELTLEYFAVENSQLEEILSRLPLLSILTLDYLYSLSKLRISSNSLNELAVCNWEDLEELEIDAPNLRLFLFEGRRVPQMSPMHTVMGQSLVRFLYRGWESFDRFAVKFRNFISQLNHIRHLDIYLEECDSLLDDMDEGVVQPVKSVPHFEELQIEMSKSGGYKEIFDGLLSNCHPHIFTLMSKNHNDYDFLPFIRELMVDLITARPSSHANTWRCCLEDIMFVAEGETHHMSVIGDVPPCFLEDIMFFDGLLSERFDIKFVFKW